MRTVDEILADMDANTRAVFRQHEQTCEPCARAKLLRVLAARARTVREAYAAMRAKMDDDMDLLLTGSVRPLEERYPEGSFSLLPIPVDEFFDGDGCFCQVCTWLRERGPAN